MSPCITCKYAEFDGDTGFCGYRVAGLPRAARLFGMSITATDGTKPLDEECPTWAAKENA